jgi:hypothetical protein
LILIFRPFVTECFSSSHCSHHGLRVSAIKSYGKFMKLSPNICTAHVRVRIYFTLDPSEILQRRSLSEIRDNFDQEQGYSREGDVHSNSV